MPEDHRRHEHPGQRAVRGRERRPGQVADVVEERPCAGDSRLVGLGAVRQLRGRSRHRHRWNCSAIGPASISAPVRPSNGPASISRRRSSTVTGGAPGARRGDRLARRARPAKRRADHPVDARCRPAPAPPASACSRPAGRELDVGSRREAALGVPGRRAVPHQDERRSGSGLPEARVIADRRCAGSRPTRPGSRAPPRCRRCRAGRFALGRPARPPPSSGRPGTRRGARPAQEAGAGAGRVRGSRRRRRRPRTTGSRRRRASGPRGERRGSAR